MLYFAKVRIDLEKLEELGRKLASGELDTTPLRHTVCQQNDPAVGMSVWEARDERHFQELFAPFREYYAEILELEPVTTAREAQQALMARFSTP